MSRFFLMYWGIYIEKTLDMDLLNVPLRWLGSHGLSLEYGWVALAWLLNQHG